MEKFFEDAWTSIRFVLGGMVTSIGMVIGYLGWAIVTAGEWVMHAGYDIGGIPWPEEVDDLE